MQPVLKMYRNSIEKHQSQRCESLKGTHPKFLRNMYFVKKHNMQANNAKAVSVPAESIKALVKPKEVNEICQPQAPATCSPHPPQAGKHIRAHIAKGHRLF
jgi:hypothetical protein